MNERRLVLRRLPLVFLRRDFPKIVDFVSLGVGARPCVARGSVVTGAAAGPNFIRSASLKFRCIPSYELSREVNPGGLTGSDAICLVLHKTNAYTEKVDIACLGCSTITFPIPVQTKTQQIHSAIDDAQQTATFVVQSHDARDSIQTWDRSF